jgi:hypothetical protein
VSLQVQHADSRLGLALALHGLPRLAGLVDAALERQRVRSAGPALETVPPSLARERPPR